MGKKNTEDSESDDSDFEISLENLSNGSSVSENTSSGSDENPTSSEKQKMKMKKNRKGAEKKKKSSAKKTQNPSLDLKQNINEDVTEVTLKNEKERTDMLWNNFLKSTGTQSKNCDNNSHESTENSQKQEIHLEVDKNDDVNVTKAGVLKQTRASLVNVGMKRRDLKSGLSNILSTISKKSKLNTLEKSKEDWNQFKEEHNLSEEINNFNRGKNGYLERQDFLQRTDSRQFEIEKELRNCGRRKTK